MGNQTYFFKTRAFWDGVGTEALAGAIDEVLGFRVRPPETREWASPFLPVSMFNGSHPGGLEVGVSSSPNCLCSRRQYRFITMGAVAGLPFKLSKGFRGDLPWLRGEQRQHNLVHRVAGTVLLDSIIGFADQRAGKNCHINKYGMVFAIDYDQQQGALSPKTELKFGMLQCTSRYLSNYTGPLSNFTCEVLASMDKALRAVVPNFYEVLSKRLSNPFWEVRSCPSPIMNARGKRKQLPPPLTKIKCLPRSLVGLSRSPSFPWDAIDVINTTHGPDQTPQQLCAVSKPKTLAFLAQQRVNKVSLLVQKALHDKCAMR